MTIVIWVKSQGLMRTYKGSWLGVFINCSDSALVLFDKELYAADMTSCFSLLEKKKTCW